MIKQQVILTFLWLTSFISLNSLYALLACVTFWNGRLSFLIATFSLLTVSYAALKKFHWIHLINKSGRMGKKSNFCTLFLITLNLGRVGSQSLRIFKLKFLPPKMLVFLPIFLVWGVIWHFFCQQKIWSGDIVELHLDPKFHQKRSNGSRVMTGDGRTNGRTDGHGSNHIPIFCKKR